MCSIYGAVGFYINPDFIKTIRENAKDRGRDGGRMESYTLGDFDAVLGNWRATPTPEIERGPLQPYNGLVHNGTIANDKELGSEEGEIDSQVLARCIDRTNVHTLAQSLSKVKGSYALACHNGKTILLACNYKPIHYWSPDSFTWYFSSMSRHFVGVCPRGQSPVQLDPYSIMDLMTGEKVYLPRTTNKKVAVVCSGGLDSVTAAWILKARGYEPTLVHFLYKCRAEPREIEAICRLSELLNTNPVFLKSPQVFGETSPLLDVSKNISPSIEGAEYAHEWVPARNLVFLAMTIAWAEAHNHHSVASGINLEESGAYPDNEEQLGYLLDKACPNIVGADYSMKVLSPCGNLMKHEIVKAGLELGVPYELTWSCYKGDSKPCGECGPCFMRREAFRRNGREDPVK